MAEGEGGYNPIGYHVGTVWPHDDSIIALRLNRYGYRDESARRLPPQSEWLEVRGLRGRWGVIDAVGRRPTVPPPRREERAEAVH